MQARFSVERVRIDGRATEYVRISDEGEDRCFYFCPECGATVYYLLPAFPDVVAVPIGGFADPGVPRHPGCRSGSRDGTLVAVPEGAEHHD